MKLICSICGMEINERNIKINSSALALENQYEAIEYCPFCGVSKRYLIKNPDNLSYHPEKNINGETLRILDHAVKLELFNGDFYKKASRLARNKNLVEMFNALANIENMHARIHMRLGGFKELPVLTDINYNKYIGDEILMEQAKIREKHAVGFYNKYINQIEDEHIRWVIKSLIRVEEDHITLLCN